MDDVLEIRLYRPAVLDLILINGGQQAFEVSYRPVRIHEGPIIRIQRLRSFRDVGVTRGDPELVVRTVVAKADEFYAGIRVEIDLVAIGRRAAGPGEHADAAIVAMRHAINLLLEDCPP